MRLLRRVPAEAGEQLVERAVAVGGALGETALEKIVDSLGDHRVE